VTPRRHAPRITSPFAISFLSAVALAYPSQAHTTSQIFSLSAVTSRCTSAAWWCIVPSLQMQPSGQIGTTKDCSNVRWPSHSSSGDVTHFRHAPRNTFRFAISCLSAVALAYPSQARTTSPIFSQVNCLSDCHRFFVCRGPQMDFRQGNQVIWRNKVCFSCFGVPTGI